MQVDQRHRVDMLRKLAHVEDFRGLVFFNSLSDLGSAEEKLQYRDILAVPSLVMSMSNLEKSS